MQHYLEACEIDYCLDEDGVIADIGILGIEFGERAEEWASTGNVHLTHRSLEGRGSDIRPESINNMLSVALIQQHQCHLEIGQRRKQLT